MCPFTILKISKKSLERIMVLKVAKCWPMWFQINHLTQKGTCFGKLSNIFFANLLSLTILEHSKQILIPGCKILTQLGPQLPIFPKRYLMKKFTISFSWLFWSILQQHFKKRSHRANHQTRWHNFGPNLHWAKRPCSPKGNLLKSWATLHWSFMSHHAT